MLTGRPSALASALTKVTGDMARIPTQDLRTAQAFNAFFFTPALGPGTALANLFSTHPSLERRLEQLAGSPRSWARPGPPDGMQRGAETRGIPGRPARPHQAGQARPGPALRPALGGDHPPGGDRLHPDRPRRGVLRRRRGRRLRRRSSRRYEALLDADSERAGVPVEFSQDAYGYTWLLSRRDPDDCPPWSTTCTR